MKKLSMRILIALVGVMVFAGTALAGVIEYDQHFKVHNNTGEKVTVTIRKGGKYGRIDREKNIRDNDADKFQFNSLREDGIKRGCGNNCSSVSWYKTWYIEVRSKDSNKWADCSFEMYYNSTQYRSKVRSRGLQSDTCNGSNLVFSGEDGRTMDITLNGWGY